MTSSKVLPRSIIMIAVMIIIAGILYNWFDIPIMQWFHQQSQGAIYKISLVIAAVFATSHWLLLAVLSLAFGLFLQFTKKIKQARAWLFFAYAYISTFFLCSAFKFILARYRPEMFLSQNLYGFHFFSFKHAWNSMPSGHAASAFAGFLALAIIFNKKWLTWLFISLAILIALSRLVVIAHYPSDIILGATLGVLVVCWTKTLYPVRHN